MAYKFLDMAPTRWRRLDGAHLLPLVRAGIAFVDGVQPEGKGGKPKAKAAAGFLQDASASVGALKADSPYVSGCPRSGKIGHA